MDRIMKVALSKGFSLEGDLKKGTRKFLGVQFSPDFEAKIGLLYVTQNLPLKIWHIM